MNRFYVISKPYGYLSQFTKEVPDHKVLSDLHKFPKDVYPVGRLDRDSEGLLLLTNDKKMNKDLLDPTSKKKKTYWVQVEGIPSNTDLDTLRNGRLTIRINKKDHKCATARVKILGTSVELPDRDPPIRTRVAIPTFWIQIELTEGKNRQVRKMFAKIGYPVLRLVRVKIGEISIEGMQSGDVRELTKIEALQALQ